MKNFGYFYFLFKGLFVDTARGFMVYLFCKIIRWRRVRPFDEKRSSFLQIYKKIQSGIPIKTERKKLKYEKKYLFGVMPCYAYFGILLPRRYSFCRR